MRFDRLLSLCLAKLMSAEVGVNGPIPVLMYHSISDDSEQESLPYYRTVTVPRVFEHQMNYLRDAGYSAVTLGELAQRLTSGSGKGRCVAITFDDGFQDFYQNAFPILEAHRFTATVFLPTAYIGCERRAFKNKPCLTWAEVRELTRYGIVFGSHTVTHPQLRDLTGPAIEMELRQSKSTIEQELGKAIDSFAYPFAFPDWDAAFRVQLAKHLVSAGYQYGVCTTVGRFEASRSSLFIKRLPVNSDDDIKLLEAKLNGAYDWVGTLQGYVKLAKGLWRPRYSATPAPLI